MESTVYKKKLPRHFLKNYIKAKVKKVSKSSIIKKREIRQ